MTSGCIIGTGCSLTEQETVPENTIIYGSQCQRREMNDKPYVSKICFTLMWFLIFTKERLMINNIFTATNRTARLPHENSAKLPSYLQAKYETC